MTDVATSTRHRPSLRAGAGDSGAGKVIQGAVRHVRTCCTAIPVPGQRGTAAPGATRGRPAPRATCQQGPGQHQSCRGRTGCSGARGRPRRHPGRWPRRCRWRLPGHRPPCRMWLTAAGQGGREGGRPRHRKRTRRRARAPPSMHNEAAAAAQSATRPHTHLYGNAHDADCHLFVWQQAGHQHNRLPQPPVAASPGMGRRAVRKRGEGAGWSMGKGLVNRPGQATRQSAQRGCGVCQGSVDGRPLLEARVCGCARLGPCCPAPRQSARLGGRHGGHGTHSPLLQGGAEGGGAMP